MVAARRRAGGPSPSAPRGRAVALGAQATSRTESKTDDGRLRDALGPVHHEVMDAGTRVKNRNGDKGTITSKVHRPLPADEANEKASFGTRITHWWVKWDLTGVDSIIRAEEVTPLARFSEPDLRTLETKFKNGTAHEDEFIVRIQDTAITFKAGNGIELEFKRAEHIADGGSYQLLESALRRFEEYEKGHWTPFTPE